MPVRWVRSIASLHELARFPGDVLHCAEDRGGEGEAGGGRFFETFAYPSVDSQRWEWSDSLVPLGKGRVSWETTEL